MLNWQNVLKKVAENPRFGSGDKNNLEKAQYLKKEIFPGYAVFARCSQTLCTIIFSQKKVGVNDSDFRQKSKNLIFDHIFEK